jgi:hypothetical protein
MKNLIKQFLICGMLASCGLWSCESPLNMDNIHTNVAPTTNDILDWYYDETKNDLVIANYEQGDIELKLNGYVLMDNPKGAVPLPSMPFAEPKENKGAYLKPLTINGKAANGTLVGKYKDKIVLEVYLQSGKRCGAFFGVTNTNKEYRTQEEKPCFSMQHDVRKPIIYLYPLATQLINVQIDFRGSLTHTYPKYPQNGWTIEAKPNGELLDKETNKVYYQLFWEGKSDYQYDMNKGFVVKGSETANFLDDKLAVLGLNRREANEFISYWLPELEKNAYNFIHFAGSEYEAQAKLLISPRPDSEIRVFMVYKPLKEWQAVENQKFETVQRKGFTVVEWGGKLQTEHIN